MKKKKKSGLSRQEAAVAVVEDIIIEMHQWMFQNLRTADPEFAAGLEADYENWMKVHVEVMRTAGEKGATINEVRRRLPDNKWDSFVKECSEAMEPPQDEQENQYFQKRVDRRLKGRDIN
jgi:hypothetical protein